VDVARTPAAPVPAPAARPEDEDTTLARTGVTPASALGLTGTEVTGTGASLVKLERNDPPRKAGNHHRRVQAVAEAAPAPPPSPVPTPAPEEPARPSITPPPVTTSPPGPASAGREVAARIDRMVPAAAERSRRSGAQPGDDLSRNSRNRNQTRRQLDEQDPYK
jgi:hypothetical protein